MINFYELLGVSRDASKDEIKTSYRNMVKKYHPDINKDEDAGKIIRSLNEAKTTLLDDNKRSEYDRLLDDINTSKEFSHDKDNSESYTEKTYQYRQEHSEVYITRWEYYIHYLKNSIDKRYIKIIKSILVGINFLVFLFLKGLIISIVYILYVINDFIDYASLFLLVIGLLYLLVLKDAVGPDYISFMPANVERFTIFTTISIVLETLKIIMMLKSTNLYAFLQNIEDKILIKVLTK